MNEIQIFKNQAFGEIRTLTIHNEPWFIGKDVAEVLGYQNTKKALADHIDPDDKLQEDGVTIRDPMGREQHPTIINESGLYSLILSSKLPSAKAFKRWVTGEVLPAIRKHGAYMTPETLQAVILNPDYLLQVVTALEVEMDCHRELAYKGIITDLKMGKKHPLHNGLQDRQILWRVCRMLARNGRQKPLPVQPTLRAVKRWKMVYRPTFPLLS